MRDALSFVGGAVIRTQRAQMGNRLCLGVFALFFFLVHLESVIAFGDLFGSENVGFFSENILHEPKNLLSRSASS